MKKIFFGLFLFLLLSIFNVTVYADEIGSEEEKDFLYEGLKPGETVVDFYSEPVSKDELNYENEVLPKEALTENESIEGESVSPMSRRKKWYLKGGKKYVGLSYGSWRYAGASTISGGVLHASHSSTVANSYSGSLNVTKRDLNAYIGFNTTKSWSKTVSYSSPSYPSGRYRLQYRHVYKKYKVKQVQAYHPKGRVYATKYVYPKRWIERNYRVVKF